MPTDPQVVPLRHVVGEHHPGVGAQPGQHGQQDAALQRLRLVDDHERVVQRAAADVGQREHLDQPAGQDLGEDVAAHQRTQGVEDRLRPGRHLLALGAGQVAQLLATDGVQRPEDDHLLVRPPLHHGLQPRAQRQRRLAGPGPAAHRDDADLGVQQQVQRDPLLGRAAVQSERLAVPAHQLHVLVGGHPAQRRAAGGEQDQPGVGGQLGGRGHEQGAPVVEHRDLVVGQRQLGHPGPAGVHRPPAAVLVGVQADRRRLDPQRDVLGHQAHVPALGPQVQRDDHDPAVVAVVAEPGRQHRGVGVVELDVQRAALVADRDRGVQPAVLHPQVVQHPQGLPGEPAQFGVVPLLLQLADHHEGDDDVVRAEAGQRARVGQQDGGVEDVRAAVGHESTPGGRWTRPASKVAGPRRRGRGPAPLVDSSHRTNRASRVRGVGLP
ncbi:unannotated protein [freshwater metagenome]|uniref:Unannotated protein n=1 Tax=freshwater metagenome TaxID=449393 RepID=A0A6J7IF02_9ZZZZ